MTWRTCVNRAVGVARLSDIQKCIVPQNPTARSPIDSFYETSQELLRVGTPTFLGQHPPMGALLLIGIVSATENYFRDLFAGLISVCPIARAKSADQSIRLGSVLWHGSDDALRGAFEHISFAGKTNLQKTSASFLGLELSQSTPLDEYEKVCQLRHCIVHSSAVLSGKNAIALHIPAGAALCVSIGFAELQECIAVCTALVATINSDLFAKFVSRWAEEWRRLPTWDFSERHTLFLSIWRLFFSETDRQNSLIASPLTAVKCRNRAATDFGVS